MVAYCSIGMAAFVRPRDGKELSALLRVDRRPPELSSRFRRDPVTTTAITNGESARTQRKPQPNGQGGGHRDATGLEKKLRTT
eukprot:206289-Hanusia_phi.AAC.1